MCIDAHCIGCGDLAVRTDDIGTFHFIFRKGYRALDIGVYLHVIERGDLAVPVDVADRVNLHVLCDRCRADNNRFGACDMIFLGNRQDVGSLSHAVEGVSRGVAVDDPGVRGSAVALAREGYFYGVGVVKEGCYRTGYGPSRALRPAGDPDTEAGIVDLIADGFGGQRPCIAAQLDSVRYNAGIGGEIGMVRRTAISNPAKPAYGTLTNTSTRQRRKK